MTQRRQRRRATWALAGLAIGMSAAIGWAFCLVPADAGGLAAEVARHADLAGAANPVTAVLLNFRSYDTLLEIAVLFLAVLGARALVPEPEEPVAAAEASNSDTGRSELLQGFVRLVAPLMVLVAGYLLWVGGHAPGGAFQSGAVLASLGVLLTLGQVPWRRAAGQRIERWLMAGGLVVFLGVGIGVMSADRALLQYPLRAAKWLILLIEAACVLSIGATLSALFHGGRLETPPTHRATEEPPE